jgi:hypothetical protein
MRRSSVLILVVAVGLVSYLIGGRAGNPYSFRVDERSARGPGMNVAENADAVGSPEMPANTPSTTVEVAGEPEPSEAPPAPLPTNEARETMDGGRLSEDEFWNLVAETRAAADGATGTQTELLEERLADLPPEEILTFARIRRQLDERAYTWDLWGAATVIEDGCSDDCFRDFRAYVISLGRRPYEDAMRDPDSLASIAEDAETGDWENADDPAPEAYSSATGSDFPFDSSDVSGTPRGRAFGEDDEAELRHRYPQLAARFR